jgi:DNA-binding PadR family transcriptional regulator
VLERRSFAEVSMRFHTRSYTCAQNDHASSSRLHRNLGLFRFRRRWFGQGDVRLIILKLISEKPSHGYEIIKAIEDRLGGAYSPSPGIVYPALTLLEEQGLIRVESTDGPRKLYAITPEGERELERNRAAAEEIFARIAEINARHGGGPAPQILRAMENLKLALRLRLSQGPLSGEQIEKIAKLLDDAAKNVVES